MKDIGDDNFKGEDLYIKIYDYEDAYTIPDIDFNIYFTTYVSDTYCIYPRHIRQFKFSELLKINVITKKTNLKYVLEIIFYLYANHSILHKAESEMNKKIKKFPFIHHS
jgi:hypothetical protein